MIFNDEDPITVDSLPAITSSEVSTNTAVFLISQKNSNNNTITSRIPFLDLSALIGLNAVNYGRVLSVFNQGNSNITFGEFEDTNTGLPKITLNFDKTSLENQITNLSTTITNVNATLTSSIVTVVNDYESKFVTVNNKIANLNSALKVNTSSHDFTAAPIPATFTFDQSVNTFNRQFELLFSNVPVTYAYNMIININIDAAPIISTLAGSRRLSIRCYGLPQSNSLVNAPNTMTINIIRTGFPTQTFVKQSTLVVPIGTQYYASALENDFTLYY